ncbi:MAG: hypothetical protein IKU05_05455 [Bacteroidales bacterium]|nr:hypothetical protein [Bacteroidales bacterium]MBR6438050.1 hypothetical protein [Bacteroidales bacterium]
MRKDLTLDTETGDLVFTNGDLAIGDSDEQNALLILDAEKGEYKEYPQVGVGLRKYLKSTGREREIRREIAVQLGLDGYDNANIETDNGTIKIEI